MPAFLWEKLAKIVPLLKGVVIGLRISFLEIF